MPVTYKLSQIEQKRRNAEVEVELEEDSGDARMKHHEES